MLAEAERRGLVPAADPRFQISSSVDSTERAARKQPAGAPQRAEGDAKLGNLVGRTLGEAGGRQVLQGAYGLYGAMGGDALAQFALNPLDRLLGTEGTAMALGTRGRSYRQVASDFADSQGMRAPQTSQERVISDIGEGLTGTGLTMGAGGLLNWGREAASTALPSISQKVGTFLTSQPAL